VAALPVSLLRVAVAHSLDVVLVAAAVAAAAAAETALFGGQLPALAGSIEALALWLHLYAHTAVHALLVGGLFAVSYSAFGARHGRTLGRALLGLTLVRESGQRPSWLWALWHASISVAATLMLGAGLFWLVVDRRHRTWGNVLSRSVISAR
jgi:uncharacterized RDD family membrane protein YckC